MIALVPVKAVVSTKGNKDVCGRNGSTKKFNAVIQVGDNFNVVEGGAAAHTGQSQTVDFVGCAKLGSSVANRHVAQNAAVVGVIVASVFCEIVVGWNSFDLRRPPKVGRGIAQHDDASPLASSVVSH